MAMIRNLPHFLRLLLGLMRDARVSAIDKALFALVIIYTLAPADLIPDVFLPLGLFDDVYLIGLSLSRLLVRAGPDVLLRHWSGDPRELGYLVERVSAIGGLLPAPIRRSLRRMVRRIA